VGSWSEWIRDPGRPIAIGGNWGPEWLRIYDELNAKLASQNNPCCSFLWAISVTATGELEPMKSILKQVICTVSSSSPHNYITNEIIPIYSNYVNKYSDFSTSLSSM
jgi:hypothetical protein